MCFRCRYRQSTWNDYKVCFFFRLWFKTASVEPLQVIRKELEEYANDDGGVMGVHKLPEFLAKVYKDRTAPIAHYIFTGHNSYITGNQLCSICSDEPIIQPLQNGVRVI
ncbi:phosphoinositide phospholipase C 2-like [Zingiber officinale]|uniref:phosphoinositide phospholipase C 2-like n=1 Tax=Zingiber officinale TaxID=94328 RepID=UPI001C4B0EDD|nr:phosphoinositide phospholipase C 2-like [Zingiber officinale]